MIEEEKLKNIRAKKMMLWFSMISMTMTFAGLTSAYVVSSSRQDWLNNFDLPFEFTISTILIFLSSITIHISKRSLLNGNFNFQNYFLWMTIILAFTFLYSQFKGFSSIIQQGYYFTGAESSITTSFLYVLVVLHMLHFIGGLIVLFIISNNSYKKIYNKSNTIGFELATIFWHFLGFLWIYLYVFVVAYN
ncbi:MAG: cytochrome c oxidase subunit 3 [Flavobacteriaceae bacterium]|nr:cytochrome c oxidase subunit 3 [Flavobacteriaceae bacterium]